MNKTCFFFAVIVLIFNLFAAKAVTVTDEGVNTDADSAYEHIMYTISHEFDDSCMVEIEINVQDTNGRSIAKAWRTYDAKPGMNELQITTAAENYWHAGGGKFLLESIEMEVKGAETVYTDVHWTKEYSKAELAMPGVIPTGACSEEFVDTNNTLGWEYYALHCSCDVNDSGQYIVQGVGEITDSTRKEVIYFGWDWVTLKPGDKSFSFKLSYLEIDRFEGSIEMIGVKVRNKTVDGWWNDYSVNFQGSYIDPAEFEEIGISITGVRPIIVLPDENDKEGYDYLRLFVTADVTKPGTYEVSGRVSDLNSNNDIFSGYTTHTITQPDSEYNLRMDFNGWLIWQYAIDELVLERASVYQQGYRIINETELCTISIDHRQFEIPPIVVLTGLSFIDYGMDIDGNGKYDSLVIAKPIRVQEAGEYDVDGYVEIGKHDYEVERTVYLDTTDTLLLITVPADFIYKSGENGPYSLEYLQIEKGNREIYEWYRWYETQAYNYTDFEQPSSINDLRPLAVELPKVMLSQNPVRPGTRLVVKAMQRIELYDINGKLVKYDEKRLEWDGKVNGKFVPGTYVVKAGNAFRKISVVK